MNRKMSVLIDENTIKQRIEEIAQAINRDYQNKNLIVVPVLSGSFIFAADLLRKLTIPLKLEFLGLKSYDRGTETSGKVNLYHDLPGPLEGQDVLIVEDIVDSGVTADFILRHVGEKKPQSIKLAALLHKPSRERVKVNIDYLGFTIEDHFVVGYGMDYAGSFRQLPYVGIMESL